MLYECGECSEAKDLFQKDFQLIRVICKVSMKTLVCMVPKRKDSTKLSNLQKEKKKSLDWSVRQPMSDHCTFQECRYHCLHHLRTFIPKHPPYLGWIIMGSQLN